MAIPNPTLNNGHVFTTQALLGFLLCNVERMDLDIVEDDAGLWFEGNRSVGG